MDQELKTMPYHGLVPCKNPECECTNCPGYKIDLTLEFNALCLMMHFYVPFIFTYFCKGGHDSFKVLRQIQWRKMLSLCTQILHQLQGCNLGIKFSLYAQRHDWCKIFSSGIKAIFAILRHSMYDQNCPSRQWLPVTPAILLQICHILLLNPTDFDNIMLWAAFLLCFFGLLRSGEITIPNAAPMILPHI